ncbi:MAG: hypothetical protein V1837_05535 [Candidatus Woesearchaeota archaeon]
MPEYLTKEEAFAKCQKQGKFIAIEDIDTEKIKSTVAIAESDVKSAEILKKNLSKEANEWSSVFKLYYDALHELSESFLRFDKVKFDNHQCLFSYLCVKHPELELSWDFLEKVRTKRNGINYYGIPTSYADWKEVELQISLYIKLLKREVEKNIEQS